MQEDKMPHSVTPESTSAEEPSATASQADSIKPEPDTQDATMEDAPGPAAAAAAETTKVNLEELFDDDDDIDGEFTSSAPVKSEDEPSQQAPLYAATPR
jgi:DNA primase small subunit